MKSQSVTTAVKRKNDPKTQYSLVQKESVASENFYFPLIGNGNKEWRQKRPDSQRNFNWKCLKQCFTCLQCGETLPLAPLAVQKDNFSTSNLPFSETLCLLFWFFSFRPPPHTHFLPSAWWLVTGGPTNHSCSIPLDERLVSAGRRWRISSANFPNAFLKTSRRLAIFTLQLRTTRMRLMSLKCGYCCAMLPEKKKISRWTYFG